MPFADGFVTPALIYFYLQQVFEDETLIKNGSGNVGRYTAGWSLIWNGTRRPDGCNGRRKQHLRRILSPGSDINREHPSSHTGFPGGRMFFTEVRNFKIHMLKSGVISGGGGPLFVVKWKTKFYIHHKKCPVRQIWRVFLNDSRLTSSKNVLKSDCRCCLFAWQTDGWSSLRKSKFHPSRVKNDAILDGYLSALLWWYWPARRSVWGDNNDLAGTVFFYSIVNLEKGRSSSVFS